MNWFKKLYKDPGTRILTYFIVFGFPAWSLLTVLLDSSNTQWWAAWVFGWLFYLLVFIPLAYFNRNTP